MQACRSYSCIVVELSPQCLLLLLLLLLLLQALCPR
jgi:hypothetical protein